MHKNEVRLLIALCSSIACTFLHSSHVCISFALACGDARDRSCLAAAGPLLACVAKHLCRVNEPAVLPPLVPLISVPMACSMKASLLGSGAKPRLEISKAPEFFLINRTVLRVELSLHSDTTHGLMNYTS